MIQNFPCIRKDQMLAAPRRDNQLRTEMILQRLQLLTQCRLGDMDKLRSGGHTSRLYNSQKIPIIIYFHKRLLCNDFRCRPDTIAELANLYCLID